MNFQTLTRNIMNEIAPLGFDVETQVVDRVLAVTLTSNGPHFIPRIEMEITSNSIMLLGSIILKKAGLFGRKSRIEELQRAFDRLASNSYAIYEYMYLDDFVSIEQNITDDVTVERVCADFGNGMQLTSYVAILANFLRDYFNSISHHAIAAHYMY